MAFDNAEDFRALEPFFRVIEEGLDGLVDGGHFFDLRAGPGRMSWVQSGRPGGRGGVLAAPAGPGGCRGRPISPGSA
jgi:hypothetical protein